MSKVLDAYSELIIVDKETEETITDKYYLTKIDLRSDIDSTYKSDDFVRDKAKKIVLKDIKKYEDKILRYLKREYELEKYDIEYKLYIEYPDKNRRDNRDYF